MATKALIFADKTIKEQPGEPRALLSAGGISLIERQLRQIKKLGLDETIILSRDFPEILHREKGNFRKVPDSLSVIDLKTDMSMASWLQDGDEFLILEESVVVDDRIIEAVYQHRTAPVLALFPPKAVVAGHADGISMQHNGIDRLFASAAKVPADLLKNVLSQDITDRTMESLLEKALADKRVKMIDIGKLPEYIPGRRRDVPLMWRPAGNAEEAGKATDGLIAAAQKGVLDWPGRWLHPAAENFIVRYSLNTPLTPNMVTVLTGVLGFFITYLFATGYLWPALIGTLAIGILDGVDGKLARVKMLASNAGQLEHILDKLVEYSWYFGLAYYLSSANNDSGPWVLATLLVLFSWAEAVQAEFFRRMTGRQLDDAGPLERQIRIVGARRNTIFWSFIPFALFGAWWLGLWVMAFYTVITFLLGQWRFMVQVRDYAGAQSSVIAKNFKDTEYF